MAATGSLKTSDKAIYPESIKNFFQKRTTHFQKARGCAGVVARWMMEASSAGYAAGRCSSKLLIVPGFYSQHVKATVSKPYHD
jgi:hypothetical protein